MGDAAQDSGQPRLHFSICFVLYVGVRQAVTTVERGATAVKQWSDGDAAEGTKGDRVSPFVNHTLAMQGRYSPCELEIAKPPEDDK